MNVLRWREQTRERLNELLPEAVVVLPIGATEQHGPHLATGTDALMAETAAERAVERAAEAAPRPLVLAPTIPVGASDHHLPFGGTLSLRPETLLAVLVDLARSVADCGGRRLVIVNGHGGNRGICSAAAAAASVRSPITVAYADYWDAAVGADLGGTPLPGHAGGFETSLVLAVAPDWVKERAGRSVVPEIPAVTGLEIHRQASWHEQDGFTDEPSEASGEKGQAWLDHLVAVLADRLVDLAKTL
ncbi:creatininase family protein [Actinopolymorpha alba]|uniref:creatininase family protein n=1 Tax=Actinopolymorpha alba TaxID=533267 RepID=UPI00036A94D5|nr:creatininase family protein [Actinopolymorpha alba]